MQHVPVALIGYTHRLMRSQSKARTVQLLAARLLPAHCDLLSSAVLLTSSVRVIGLKYLYLMTSAVTLPLPGVLIILAATIL